MTIHRNIAKIKHAFMLMNLDGYDTINKEKQKYKGFECMTK